LARLEKDFKTNPPFKAEPEMALLFFCPERKKHLTRKLNVLFACGKIFCFEGATTQ
jgi:hypothetical protein